MIAYLYVHYLCKYIITIHVYGMLKRDRYMEAQGASVQHNAVLK